MKCNHCNNEVADGTNFCPYCGNRIELSQSLRCPQCNTELSDGTKFCPNCGSPVGVPQPKKCSQCGAELEDGERFCSNCGTPVGGNITQPHTYNNPQPQVHKSQVHQFNSNSKSLFLRWEGGPKWSLFNTSIAIVVDGKQYGEFKMKEPSELIIPITSSLMEVKLKFMYINTEIKLDLEPNRNYQCDLHFSGGISGSGIIAYTLTDDNGNIVKTDGDVSIGMQLLCFLILLVGFIYFFVKKGSNPVSAKVGLIWGFMNLALNVILWIMGY